MADVSSTYESIKQKVKIRLTQELTNGAKGTNKKTQHTPLDRETIAIQLRALLSSPQAETKQLVLSIQKQEQLLDELTNEITEMGPLDLLLDDADVTEIMVNGPDQIFVERRGQLDRTSAVFRDTHHLMSVIERFLNAAGVSVTESEPCVDASLPNGNRLNVIIPPAVLNGPTLTIRKKVRQWKMEDFIARGSLSIEAAEFLEACVKAKINLLVSGATSTGKTTLVGLLSAFIPQHERIITIENTGELELPNREHWIRLVARVPNIEGRGEISLRTLVNNALRMRPDRIILGEARSGEALDMVQAMQTGHDGVMTVLHANSPYAALERLETLMLMSGLELPPQACRVQIARAIDVVIHVARYTDGSRRVASIAQVLDNTSSGFQLEELFIFEVRGFRVDGTLDGSLRYTGARPKFLQQFQDNNVPTPGWIT